MLRRLLVAATLSSIATAQFPVFKEAGTANGSLVKDDYGYAAQIALDQDAKVKVAWETDYKLEYALVPERMFSLDRALLPHHKDLPCYGNTNKSAVQTCFLRAVDGPYRLYFRERDGRYIKVPYHATISSDQRVSFTAIDHDPELISRPVYAPPPAPEWETVLEAGYEIEPSGGYFLALGNLASTKGADVDISIDTKQAVNVAVMPASWVNAANRDPDFWQNNWDSLPCRTMGITGGHISCGVRAFSGDMVLVVLDRRGVGDALAAGILVALTHSSEPLAMTSANRVSVQVKRRLCPSWCTR